MGSWVAVIFGRPHHLKAKAGIFQNNRRRIGVPEFFSSTPMQKENENVDLSDSKLVYYCDRNK